MSNWASWPRECAPRRASRLRSRSANRPLTLHLRLLTTSGNSHSRESSASSAAALPGIRLEICRRLSRRFSASQMRRRPASRQESKRLRRLNGRRARRSHGSDLSPQLKSARWEAYFSRPPAAGGSSVDAVPIGRFLTHGGRTPRRSRHCRADPVASNPVLRTSDSASSGPRARVRGGLNSMTARGTETTVGEHSQDHGAPVGALSLVFMAPKVIRAGFQDQTCWISAALRIHLTALCPTCDGLRR